MKTNKVSSCVVVVVVVVNFIKHQNRSITGEPVAARASPSVVTTMSYKTNKVSFGVVTTMSYNS